MENKFVKVNAKMLQKKEKALKRGVFFIVNPYSIREVPTL
jgi:hypothetical protein